MPGILHWGPAVPRPPAARPPGCQAWEGQPNPSGPRAARKGRPECRLTILSFTFSGFHKTFTPVSLGPELASAWPGHSRQDHVRGAEPCLRDRFPGCEALTSPVGGRVLGALPGTGADGGGSVLTTCLMQPHRLLSVSTRGSWEATPGPLRKRQTWSGTWSVLWPELWGKGDHISAAQGGSSSSPCLPAAASPVLGPQAEQRRAGRGGARWVVVVETRELRETQGEGCPPGK